MGNKEKIKRDVHIDEIAELVMILFCISPLFAAIINYTMILDMSTYNAYTYNWCFMYITNPCLCLVSVCSLTYIIKKAIGNKSNLHDYIRTYLKKERWLIFWILFAPWALICCLCSVDIRGALLGATEMSGGLISYAFMIGVMFCVFILNPKQRNRMLKIYMIVSDILAAIMLGFQYDIPVLMAFTPDTGASVFTNPNHYGYYLCVAILCMIGKFYICILEEKRKDKRIIKFIAYILSIAMNMHALMINDTLGAFLAVFFAGLILMLLWRIRFGRLSFWHFVPMIILLADVWLSYIGIIQSKIDSTIGTSLIVFFADLFKLSHKAEGYKNGGTGRIQLWLDTIERIKEKPILGHGADIMYDANGQQLMWTSAHNEFLEIALYFGIPGLVLYLGGLITLCVDRCKKLKELPSETIMAAAAVMGYLISSFFGVRKYHTVPYLFVFLGLLLLKNRKADTEADSERNQSNERNVAKESNYAKIWKELKKCKTLRSIFEVIGDKGIRKISKILLICWCIIPIFSAFNNMYIHITYAGLNYYTEPEIVDYYIGIVRSLGIISIVACILLMYGKRCVDNRRFGQGVKDKLFGERWLLCLLGLLTWIILSTVFSQDIKESFLGSEIRFNGLIAVLIYGSVFVLGYLLTDETGDVLRYFFVISDILAAIMLMHEWGIPIIYEMSTYACSSVFSNSNHYGYFLTLSVMGLAGMVSSSYINKNNDADRVDYRWFYMVSLALQVYVLLLNDTLGSYLAVAIATIVVPFVWRTKNGTMRWQFWIPAMMVFVGTVLSFGGLITNSLGGNIAESLKNFWADLFHIARQDEQMRQAGTNRLGLWLDTIEMIKHKPIFGYGPDILQSNDGKYALSMMPHNEYLEYALFSGIPALCLYLASLVTLCVEGCKKIRKLPIEVIVMAGSIIGYLISAFTGNTKYYVTPYLYMMLGIVAGACRKNSKN